MLQSALFSCVYPKKALPLQRDCVSVRLNHYIMQIDNIYTVIFAAVLPPFLLVFYIWYKDKQQREPIFEMGKGFLYGVISAGIALVLELALTSCYLVPDEPTTLFQAGWKAFLGAAIPEELAKLFMLWLLLRRNRYFDERFDGIVYAVCVGMGFAATENIIYLFSNLEAWQSVAVGRAMFAVPGHFLFAVTMGYFYSMISFGDLDWRKSSRIFWAPVLLHGTYDALLMMSSVGTMWSGILLIGFYIFCFKMLQGGRRRIAEQLERDKKRRESLIC